MSETTIAPPVRVVIPPSRLGLKKETFDMTEADFYARWDLKESRDGSCVFEYRWLPSHTPKNCIWTWVDTDDGRTALVAGRHYVNAVGFAISTTPWVTGDEVMVTDPVRQEV